MATCGRWYFRIHIGEFHVHVKWRAGILNQDLFNHPRSNQYGCLWTQKSLVPQFHHWAWRMYGHVLWTHQSISGRIFRVSQYQNLWIKLPWLKINSICSPWCVHASASVCPVWIKSLLGKCFSVCGWKTTVQGAIYLARGNSSRAAVNGWAQTWWWRQCWFVLNHYHLPSLTRMLAWLLLQNQR